MEVSQEVLNEITSLAEAFTSPLDIAAIIQLNADDFFLELKKPDSKIRVAFLKGKLFSEAKLRKSIIAIACQGSSPAQALAIKLRDEMNMSIMKSKL